MKTLQRLVGVIALTFMFAFGAFADCVPPNPGEVQSPPCSAAQVTPDEPVASAKPSDSSTSSSAGVIEISVTTLDVLLGAVDLLAARLILKPSFVAIRKFRGNRVVVCLTIEVSQLALA